MKDITLKQLHTCRYCIPKCKKFGTKMNAWIYICSYPDSSGSGLLDVNKIIIKDTDISIIFNYPLKKNFLFKFNNMKGFSGKDLIDNIVNTYKKIYIEEESTSTIRIVPMPERIANGGMVNRNHTDGKYGIWGHDIDDLCIEIVQYDDKNKVVHLGVGS